MGTWTSIVDFKAILYMRAVDVWHARKYNIAFTLEVHLKVRSQQMYIVCVTDDV